MSTHSSVVNEAVLVVFLTPILQVGQSTYLTHHEIMDAELTREQPLPSARATKVTPTTTPSSPA